MERLSRDLNRHGSQNELLNSGTAGTHLGFKPFSVQSFDRIAMANSKEKCNFHIFFWIFGHPRFADSNGFGHKVARKHFIRCIQGSDE